MTNKTTEYRTRNTESNKKGIGEESTYSENLNSATVVLDIDTAKLINDSYKAQKIAYFDKEIYPTKK